MIDFHMDYQSTERGRGPDLMPLIDMVFILLIFFLLTSSTILPAIDVALPEAEGTAIEAAAITVTIQADGSLLLEGSSISLKTLLPALKAELRRQPQAELAIQADRRVSFGRVIEIMDLGKQAGAEDVSFLVETKIEE